jgi:hypothetical protein
LEVKSTFTADVPGVYVSSLVVSDGKLSSESTVVLVQAANFNAAPVAMTGPAQTVLINSAVTLDGSGSRDDNNDRLTYKWQLISQPAGCSADMTEALSARPFFTADVAGVYVASLTVFDGQLFSEPKAVTVTAVAANTPPVAVAGANQNVLTGSEVKLDGVGSFDVNRDQIFYRWSLVAAPSGSTAKLSVADSAKGSFTADVSGIYVIGLVVNDTQLFSEMSVVTVTASAQNVAPVAVAGPAQNVLKGSLVNLDGSDSSDSNGDLLRYKWSMVSVPTGSTASLAVNNVPKPSFTADASGVYVLALVVSDGILNSDPSTVTVTSSSANLPPVADAGPEQTVRVGVAVQLSGSKSSDANGDALTYSWTWTSNPSNATLTGGNTVSPSFTPTVAGIYVLTLTVMDGKGGSHVARVLINVE